MYSAIRGKGGRGGDIIKLNEQSDRCPTLAQTWARKSKIAREQEIMASHSSFCLTALVFVISYLAIAASKPTGKGNYYYCYSNTEIYYAKCIAQCASTVLVLKYGAA